MSDAWKSRRRVFYAIFTAALLTGFTATGQPPEDANTDTETVKPPWEWTLEERLNARFDPQKIRERMRNRGHNPQLDTRALPQNFEILAGKEHPHLFLPHRVFDALIEKAFSSDRDLRTHFRSQYFPDLYGGELAIDEAFWRDLSIILSFYFNVKDEIEVNRAKIRSLDDMGQKAALETKDDELHMKLCRVRYQALQEAREHFGRPEFDRFLYETSAITLWETGEWDARKRQVWTNIERGCPNAH